MQTINNNDILFDDFALMNESVHFGQHTISPIIFGDCDNRFETETVEMLRPDDITVLVTPSIDGHN